MGPEEIVIAAELLKFIYNGVFSWMKTRGATSEQINQMWAESSAQMLADDPNELLSLSIKGG